MIKILPFLLCTVAACAPTATPVPDDKTDFPPPDVCGSVIVCASADDVGEQTRGISGACFECVATSVPAAPFAWVRVAPCAIADDGEG